MQCSVCAKPETESEKLMLCSRCKSTPYCSAECQRAGWKDHKKVCKLFNQGIGSQISHPDHREFARKAKEHASVSDFQNESPQHQQVWKLFENKAGKPDAFVIREMKKIFFRMPRNNRGKLLLDLIPVLLHSKTKIVKKKTSPFLALVQNKYVDPDVNLLDTRTALHVIAQSADGIESMENQVFLGQQIIAAGANVNIFANKNITPLHVACSSILTTNLDFIKLLLDNGADPNARSPLQYGGTPLMFAIPESVGAARFVVEYDGPVRVDLNVRDNDGDTLLVAVRNHVAKVRRDLASGSLQDGEATRLHYQLPQLVEFEQILVTKGATH